MFKTYSTSSSLIDIIQKHSIITLAQNYSYSIFLYFCNCLSRKLLSKIIASADDILWKSKACFIHYSRSTFRISFQNEIHSYSSFCINHRLQEISYSRSFEAFVRIFFCVLEVVYCAFAKEDA